MGSPPHLSATFIPFFVSCSVQCLGVSFSIGSCFHSQLQCCGWFLCQEHVCEFSNRSICLPDFIHPSPGHRKMRHGGLIPYRLCLGRASAPHKTRSAFLNHSLSVALNVVLFNHSCTKEHEYLWDADERYPVSMMLWAIGGSIATASYTFCLREQG